MEARRPTPACGFPYVKEPFTVMSINTVHTLTGCLLDVEASADILGRAARHSCCSCRTGPPHQQTSKNQLHGHHSRWTT